MFDLALLISVIGTIIQSIKDSCIKTIPAENWANKELYHKDIMSGMSDEQLIKNVENGRYKLTKTYPEPHKDPVSGQIVIENYKLYREDVMKYGGYQAKQWVKQGKYNLTPKELAEVKKQTKEKYDKMLGLI